MICIRSIYSLNSTRAINSSSKPCRRITMFSSIAMQVVVQLETAIEIRHACITLGMSRSATIACAYLMKKHQWSYDVALERVKSKRPCVYPNPGFVEQLRLYHAKNYTVRAKVSAGEQRSTDAPAAGEDAFQDVLPGNSSVTPFIEYKCKLCRQILFTDADLVSHIAGQGRFDYHARGSAYKAKQNAESTNKDFCQQELFTVQPDWFPDVSEKDTNDGEIECPNSKCRGKIGRYSTVGEKCTCAKWVTPAFHFHRSKVDECPSGKNDQIQKLLLRRTIV